MKLTLRTCHLGMYMVCTTPIQSIIYLYNYLHLKTEAVPWVPAAKAEQWPINLFVRWEYSAKITMVIFLALALATDTIEMFGPENLIVFSKLNVGQYLFTPFQCYTSLHSLLSPPAYRCHSSTLLLVICFTSVGCVHPLP